MSAAEARRALASGKVYLGDTPTADATREVEPSQVSVRPAAPRIRVGSEPVCVFRDPHLAVVWKPPAMLAVPAPGRRSEASVLSMIGRVLGSALPVHRLDEGTSGLMMVARTSDAQLGLKELLFAHRIDRVYLALVRGRFPSQPIHVDNVIVRDRGDGLRGVGSGEGKSAISDFALVEPLGSRHSLVQATLSTGRTHQIRVHLSDLGYPLLGDALYGDGKPRDRLAPHSFRLAFDHPVTGKRHEFLAPLADDLQRLRQNLLI